MKLKVKPDKIQNKRFEELLGIMRHWPEYQRSIVHELLRHVQYLNSQIEQLEKINREYRETSFLEEKKIIEQRASILESKPTLSPSLKKITEKKYTPRGERYYYLLETGGYKNYLKLHDTMNVEKMIELANEWAFANNKPKINLVIG